VGVVTDLGGAEALAEHDVRDTDQMLKVLRTQVDVILNEGVGVLNAADERVADLARLCDGSVIFYALDESAPAMVAHRARGGRAVFQRGRDCVLAEAAAETLLSGLRPLAAGGETLPPEALLPAVAAAWAMGVAPDLITAGVQTFGPAAVRIPAARPHALIDDRKGND